MTDSFEEIEEEDEEKKKKGKGETDAGAMTRGEAIVSPGFIAYMMQIGASKAVIAEIFRTWRHLKGEGLMKRVAEVLRGLVKSKHIQVKIGPNENYSIVHDVTQFGKNAEMVTPSTKPVHAPDMHNLPKPQ